MSKEIAQLLVLEVIARRQKLSMSWVIKLHWRAWIPSPGCASVSMKRRPGKATKAARLWKNQCKEPLQHKGSPSAARNNKKEHSISKETSEHSVGAKRKIEFQTISYFPERHSAAGAPAVPTAPGCLCRAGENGQRSCQDVNMLTLTCLLLNIRAKLFGVLLLSMTFGALIRPDAKGGLRSAVFSPGLPCCMPSEAVGCWIGIASKDGGELGA
ncbi:uncharacterized protein [Struthio camelus]|uniref:uncharacterized protein isoform X2 n=1 Tax=Struthio camelus TaxID=8801 RepID=UPI003603D83E